MPRPANPDIQRLQAASHVPLGVLGVVAPIADPTLPEEQIAALELSRPNGAVGPGRLQTGGVGHGHLVGDAERECRPPLAVVEAGHGVMIAIPAGVAERAPRGRVERRVAIGIVTEDVAGVMGNDVENDIDSLFVCGSHEVAELLPRAEVRVHVQEVLHAVAMVARLECDLAKGRTDPQRG